MKLTILTILIFAFCLAGCNSEPKEDFGRTPPEITAALNDYLKNINPKDMTLGIQTYQYSNDKFLLFAKHYTDPAKAGEFAQINAQAINTMETPFIAKKTNDAWVISFPTISAQKLESVNVRKYKYCQKRTETDLKNIFCGEDAKDGTAEILAGAKVGWIDPKFAVQIVQDERAAAEKIQK